MDATRYSETRHDATRGVTILQSSKKWSESYLSYPTNMKYLACDRGRGENKYMFTQQFRFQFDTPPVKLPRASILEQFIVIIAAISHAIANRSQLMPLCLEKIQFLAINDHLTYENPQLKI